MDPAQLLCHVADRRSLTGSLVINLGQSLKVDEDTLEALRPPVLRTWIIDTVHHFVLSAVTKEHPAVKRNIIYRLVDRVLTCKGCNNQELTDISGIPTLWKHSTKISK